MRTTTRSASSAAEIDARLARRLQAAAVVVQAKKDEEYRREKTKRRWEKSQRLTDVTERHDVAHAADLLEKCHGSGSARRPATAGARLRRRPSLATQHGLASVVSNVTKLGGELAHEPAPEAPDPGPKPPPELTGMGTPNQSHTRARPATAAASRGSLMAGSILLAASIESGSRETRPVPARPSTAAPVRPSTAGGGGRRQGSRQGGAARSYSERPTTAPAYREPPSYAGLRAATLARAKVWALQDLEQGEIRQRRRAKTAQQNKLRRFYEREAQTAMDHAGVEILDTESEAGVKLAAAVEKATAEAKARWWVRVRDQRNARVTPRALHRYRHHPEFHPAPPDSTPPHPARKSTPVPPRRVRSPCTPTRPT